VQSALGSNLGPHWEEEGIANAKNVSSISHDKMAKMQDKAYEGNMLDRIGYGPPGERAVHSEGY
jgi:hypothetical protein